MTRIAIFGSGRGSNARSILEYFMDHPTIEVALIVSNKKEAGILDLAREYGISLWSIDKAVFDNSQKILTVLDKENISYLILAGFLWLIPPFLIAKYPNRILNIHPALLPKYGGKGMYGHHIHKAVFDNKEVKSGISIHEVNEIYDDGNIIEQIECDISDCRSPEEIGTKVLSLEHKHFAPTIESWIDARK